MCDIITECYECGITDKPFSLIFPKRCDVCADWHVFDAMLDFEWYVHEQSARTAYNMDLCAWYKAVDKDGVPLGYHKPNDTYYPPYDTQKATKNNDLTKNPTSAMLSKSVQKRLAIQQSPPPSITGFGDTV